MTYLPRTVAAAAALALSFAGSLAFCGTASAVEIEQVTSPGGIKALLVEDHSNPLIAVQFSFKGAGSTQDPVGKEGLANLMSGLLDEGAGDIKSEDFQSRLDNLGMSLGFDADLDDFSGSFRTITDVQDDAFDLLRLAIDDPRFDPEPVERIRSQIKTGIIADRNDPGELASKAFQETVFAGHPYSRPVDGTVESLDKISPDDLRAFHKNVFAKNNLVVGVVGDITREELGKRLDSVFGGLAQKPDLNTIPEAKPNFDRTVSVDLAVPQTSIQFALPGVKRDDPQFFAAYLMNHIFGGGTFTSRLYTQVREKRGLAYGAGSFLASYDHAAVLGISTATRSDKAAETVDIIRKQLKEMADQGPSAQELDKAKAYVAGAYAIRNLDSSLAIASTLVGIQLDDLGYDYIDKRKDLINAVTLDEVKAMARKLLSVDPTVITVGQAGA